MCAAHRLSPHHGSALSVPAKPLSSWNQSSILGHSKPEGLSIRYHKLFYAETRISKSVVAGGLFDLKYKHIVMFRLNTEKEQWRTKAFLSLPCASPMR